MEAEAKDLTWYREELESNGCACDRSKKPGYAFCYRCHTELPAEMKRALHKPIGKGYESAYESAFAFLSKGGFLDD